ncbi:hypothetical protein SEMRO_2472_G328680.1 [Seminavis robusta]|uniref:Uncharacterized protein n=1 Tax=Seminavis robusta TaxID=568900 RepID=A0A9N8HVZ6_9STRA|nr:hypothetical protein SEMRO_2472_G328680.1 [Seminavis robusta]|eukprot:Sro2472_g328680.1 n/a (153) ;mRNA; r:13445-13903
MTVNQYSKTVPIAGNTPALANPLTGTTPASAPPKPPPRPQVHFKNVVEAVPLPFSQVQEARRNTEKNDSIPPRGPFHDPYAGTGNYAVKPRTPKPYYNPYHKSGQGSGKKPQSQQQQQPLTQPKSGGRHTSYDSGDWHTQKENSPPNYRADV